MRLTSSVQTGSNGTAIWKWAFSTLLGMTLTLGWWTFQRVDARIQTLEDARIPHAVTETEMRAQVGALTDSISRLELAIEKLNVRLDQQPPRR